MKQTRAIQERTMYCIKCTGKKNGVEYQLNKVGASPVGDINPFTGKPEVPRLWKTRKGAEAHRKHIAHGWERSEVLELTQLTK